MDGINLTLFINNVTRAQGRINDLQNLVYVCAFTWLLAAYSCACQPYISQADVLKGTASCGFIGDA